ncbi:MAG: TonB-dependent receptor [Sphingobacteriaceae bacterium]|nr:MAG: TonB-dependent receptor [Sphingobacteriaceae bacterium]
MYNKLLPIIILLISSFYVQSAAAQQPAAKIIITGKVLDSVSRQPLEFITVGIFDNNGRAITGGYTNTDGTYRLALQKDGQLRVRYSLVGYNTKETLIQVTATGTTTLPNVYLNEVSKALDEVKITAARKLIVQKPGMLVYNAGNDPSNKGGTATDVLRKAPVLNVDAQGNVSMRGSGNIKILIDGKYSGQMARSPADALNMMSADIIQSVEVITTPSAKYDAEGAAGVINIITKKGGKQVSGSLEVAGGNWGQVINPRFSMANKKWNINANAHLHRLRQKSANNYQRSSFNRDQLTDIDTLISVLDQRIVKDNTAPHGSATVNTEYTIDSLNLLSIGITSWFGNWPENSLVSTRVTLPDGIIEEQYNQNVDTRAAYLGGDINIGFTHKFKKPGRELALLAQFSPSKDNSRYLADQISPAGILTSREQNNNYTKNREWTFQADYLHPFGRDNKYSFEGGAKMIRRSVGTNYLVARSTASAPNLLEPVPDRTNIFDYSQDVIAGYAIIKFNLPGNWYIETGARVEGTVLKGNFASGNGSFSKNFVNFVPTATLSKKLSETQTINLSYTKRLTRPYISDLSPNINSSDPKNIVAGNPQLQPEMAHQAELSYGITTSSGISFNPAIFWKQTNNSIEDLTITDTSGISTTSKQNLAANRQYGINLSATFPLNAKWSLNNNINISRLDFKSTALQIATKGWGAEFTLNSTYKLPKNLAIQAFGSYNTRTVTLQGYETQNYFYTFAVKKELTASKIVLTLATVNPFTKAVKQTEAIKTTTFNSINLVYHYQQGVKLTVAWEFGKLFQQAKGRKIKNDDIKGQPKG